MTLTDGIEPDECVALGDYCEGLQQQPSWSRLLDIFEGNVAKEILHTAPDAKAQREAAYASYQGVRDFLSLMTFFVQTRDNIINDNQPTPSTTDASEDI